jgi:ATP-dependent Lon protease
VLDTDHFDLEKVKDRIIEYLAVAKLRREISGQILCFVGPPGVGKTSLGHSIANALGRKFVRLSVGGVRDESEIRGHRRTYIGSMPGSIIRSLRDAESSNPLVLIDEIDKMGADWRGDPASAMLEVLDPAQNDTFRDHYLDLPFDLSKVLFICTANTLDTIPGPLLDRMDVIQLSGYTEDEKLGIAKRYLLPKQREAHGLKKSQLAISDRLLRVVIREYTREAGVRSLERRLADVCRKAATQVAKGKEQKIRVDEARLREWLGPRRFSGDVRKRTADAGVATGLAYTTVGGDVLFIEATAYPGKGRLTITGQLGEVMQESAQAALSWVRAHSGELGLPEDWFAEHDVHIHVPAGAVPKDGPSAGVTMATAIASLVRGTPVASDIGMTGEITLTGQVLPIGGLREKSLAAQRAGLKRIVFPRENEPDLDELPPETRKAMTFIPADTIEDVFAAAFNGGKSRPGANGARTTRNSRPLRT